MNKNEMKMVDITDDLKDLIVEETRKAAEEYMAEFSKEELKDWFYNLPSIKRCTIDKAILEKMNKRE